MSSSSKSVEPGAVAHETTDEQRRSLAAELNEIALRCASLPDVAETTEDEILGYDEFGAPTR